MADIIRQTIKSGKVVIWEEVARDGAQAETLLSGEQRVKIARQQGDIFGEHGPEHLIFAAGYPSICKEEFKYVCQVAEQVENCSLATHGRVIRSDVDLGIKTMKRAKYGRVSFALPISDKHCQIMLHKTKEETLQQAIEVARYALDKADGVPIDVAFGVSSRVDPAFLAEAATALADEGIATIKICDSTGELFPFEIKQLFRQVMEQVPPHVVIGAHLHNDFGLALANYLEALRFGVRMLCSSWLGLGERVGLAATEQVLLALAIDLERISERLGIDSPLWLSPPDLKQVTPIAQEVSQMLAIPLKMTDPVISTTMNHVATGAYFNNPMEFKPFDPEAVLGIPPQLILTHLANRSIIEVIANEMGYRLNEEQTSAALKWVKSQAYTQHKSVVSRSEFEDYLTSQKVG
jgi:2-isopropylmalate synthase